MNTKSENIDWIIEIEEYTGPEPDWSWHWFERGCLLSGCDSKKINVFTRNRSDGVVYHSAECYACGKKLGHAPNYVPPDKAGEFIVPIGSYKGKKLKDTPKSWRQWVLAQETMPKTLRRRIATMLGIDSMDIL